MTFILKTNHKKPREGLSPRGLCYSFLTLHIIHIKRFIGIIGTGSGFTCHPVIFATHSIVAVARFCIFTVNAQRTNIAQSIFYGHYAIA